MKTLLIDDQNTLFSKLDYLTVLNKLESPELISQNIYKNYSSYDLFVININYKAENIRRSQNPGIILLKYLRLKNLNQHCVIFSFLSREQLLLQNPENLIVFSDGLTFLRLPDDMVKLKFDELVKKTAPRDLSAFFKAETIMPDDRHFFANWWGVLQLWKVHKAQLHDAGIAMTTEIENSFTISIKEMNSYQGLLARYLYREKEKNIEDHLKQLQQNQIERFGKRNEEIGMFIKVYDQKIGELSIIAQKIEILNEALIDEGAKTIFQSVLEKLKMISEPISKKINQLVIAQANTEDEATILKEYIELDSLIKEEKINIEKENNRLNLEIVRIMHQIEGMNIFSNKNLSVTVLRERLKVAAPRILFIDDQADDGWGFIFQQMIYEGLSESFHVIKPEKDDSIDKTSSDILQQVIRYEPDLIILDLRLKGEIGLTTNISNLSGIQVLKMLSQRLTCPVLITTASNKIWSYKETFKNGALAFWIKEGLDENRDIRFSIENYIRFVEIVYILTQSEEFKKLKNWKVSLQQLKTQKEEFWWQHNDWVSDQHIYPKTKIIDREEIFSIFTQSICVIEDFFRLKLQESQNISTEHLPSAIITQLSSVLENIHQTDDPYSETGRISLSSKLRDQFSNALKPRIEMLDIRNRAVHDNNCSFYEMVDFVDHLFVYLSDYNSILKVIVDLKEPIDGKEYITVVEKIDKNYSTRFYLRNPNLNLLCGLSNIIMDARPNNNPQLENVNIEKGDFIKFNLSIKTTYPPNYYAINATKIN
ncbi:MAG: hypothetical protein Q8J88_11365 [Bacteroidales bacterium]|nr:hypothetical protein [Bacteroidales bacterium]